MNTLALVIIVLKILIELLKNMNASEIISICLGISSITISIILGLKAKKYSENGKKTIDKYTNKMIERQEKLYDLNDFYINKKPKKEKEKLKLSIDYYIKKNFKNFSFSYNTFLEKFKHENFNFLESSYKNEINSIFIDIDTWVTTKYLLEIILKYFNNSNEVKISIEYMKLYEKFLYYFENLDFQNKWNNIDETSLKKPYDLYFEREIYFLISKWKNNNNSKKKYIFLNKIIEIEECRIQYMNFLKNDFLFKWKHIDEKTKILINEKWIEDFYLKTKYKKGFYIYYSILKIYNEIYSLKFSNNLILKIEKFLISKDFFDTKEGLWSKEIKYYDSEDKKQKYINIYNKKIYSTFLGKLYKEIKNIFLIEKKWNESKIFSEIPNDLFDIFIHYGNTSSMSSENNKYYGRVGNEIYYYEQEFGNVEQSKLQ